MTFKLFILTILSFFIFNNSFGQTKIFRITNLKNKKETIIKQHKRVRVKTISGKKVTGRILFVDKNSIVVDGQLILLNDIKKIKKNPLSLAIPTSIITGGIFIGGVALLGGKQVLQEQVIFYGTTLVIGTSIIISKSINVLKSHKIDTNKFEIVSQ